MRPVLASARSTSPRRIPLAAAQAAARPSAPRSQAAPEASDIAQGSALQSTDALANWSASEVWPWMTYNKARQAAITKELSEIVAGAAAV